MESITTTWFDPLTSTAEMRRIFSDQARLNGILRFESALAIAEAKAKVIPSSSAEVIASKCRAELFDIPALSVASIQSGNSAIQVVSALTALVEQEDAVASRYVHWGATSQDAMDTGFVLQLSDALDYFESELLRLAKSLALLAELHKNTILVGRTWLQHASPTTFGFKVAGWLNAILRHIEHVQERRERSLVLQFGGSSGGLSAFDCQTSIVAQVLAEELRLACPVISWHAHRDRFAEVSATIGVMAGTLGKIARDISLLSQTEIGEVAEAKKPGRGGSSSMPQKQNPVGCAMILSAANQIPGLVSTVLTCMIQENERGLGGWQAEWEAIPRICLLAAGALAHLNDVVDGLEVDKIVMASNLEMTDGLVYSEGIARALSHVLGRARAHRVVEDLCHQVRAVGISFRKSLLDSPEVLNVLTVNEIDQLLDPERHIQVASMQVDKVLKQYSEFLSKIAQLNRRAS